MPSWTILTNQVSGITNHKEVSFTLVTSSTDQVRIWKRPGLSLPIFTNCRRKSRGDWLLTISHTP